MPWHMALHLDRMEPVHAFVMYQAFIENRNARTYVAVLGLAAQCVCERPSRRGYWVKLAVHVVVGNSVLAEHGPRG